MTTTTTYNFTDPQNYTFDDQLIEFENGHAKLKLQDNPGQSVTENFDNDTGFTYNSSDAEFTGGQLQQVDQAPGVGMWADFDIDENLTWGLGGTTGLLGNGATYNSTEKWIDCTTTNSYWLTNDELNTPVDNTGHIKFTYVPDFQDDQGVSTLFELRGKVGGGNENRILMEQLSTGKIRTTIWDSSGAVGANIQTTSPFAFTQDADHVIELAVDTTTGDTKLFINGNQRLPTITNTMTRDLQNDGIQFGDNNGDGNGRIRQVTVYDSPQTPLGSNPPDIRFNETYIVSPTKQFTGSLDGQLQSVLHWMGTSVGDVKYTFNLPDGTAYWYDGNSWVVSNETYAQANSESDMETYLSLFPFPDGTRDFKYGITLAATNNVGNSISNLLFMYTDQIYSITNPELRPNVAFNSSQLQNFMDNVVEPGSDKVKYIIYTAGQDRWVSGGTAQNSDGTYAQSSTAAEINSDVLNIIVNRGTTYPKIFLHSNDGQTTPYINALQVDYLLSPSNPDLTLCNFDAIIYGHSGPIANETVYIRPFVGFINDNVLHRYKWEVLGTTDSTGWLTADIYVQADGSFWEMRVAKQRYKFQLPDSTEADFSTLLSFEVLS